MKHNAKAWLLAAAATAWATAAAAADVKVAPYGVTKDGKAVTAYTLVNDRGTSATIIDHGARIIAVRVPDRRGRITNTVMAFKDMAGWESMDHANAILGRVSNRITRGFSLDGVRYELQPNAAGVTMHSAPNVWSNRLWAVQPIRPAEGAAVTLTLDSPDMDQGYPGRVQVKATYRWTNDNSLRLDMEAVTDKPTVINLTNHVYFNLNGNGTVPVYNHELQVMSDQMAVLDPVVGATGEIRPVAGTPVDFTKPTIIAERLGLARGPEYADPATAPPAPPGTIRTFNLPYFAQNGLDRGAARLRDPESGRVLEVRTTEPSVHVYTPPLVRGDFLTDTGKPFARVPAIALETQHLPDSPNRPEFPSVVLRPGQTFRSTTVFTFRTDAPQR